MNKLLTRDQFRQEVFQRDQNSCVICFGSPVSAHHIMEKRLFDDFGYYLDNGASLCDKHHRMAENTTLSPDDLYKVLGIKERILPNHLSEDYRYTKWGDIQNPNGTRYKGELFNEEPVQKVLSEAGLLHLYVHRFKYPRTYHLPWSNWKNDDKALVYTNHLEGEDVVITEKLDGENTTGYSDGYIHARSLEWEYHESRTWVKSFLANKLCELPEGWRICGENMYAKHSIHYSGLKSYFYFFSIWDEDNNCLNWDDTLEWARLLDLEVVPTVYSGLWDEDKVKALSNLGGGVEGYVVRTAKSFPYASFRRNTAKYVRANHVQTSQHWKSEAVVKNLIAELK